MYFEISLVTNRGDGKSPAKVCCNETYAKYGHNEEKLRTMIHNYDWVCVRLRNVPSNATLLAVPWMRSVRKT